MKPFLIVALLLLVSACSTPTAPLPTPTDGPVFGRVFQGTEGNPQTIRL